MSLIGALGVVVVLRTLGFVGRIGGVQAPIVILLPYLGLIATFVLGYFAISRAIIIEPPTFVVEAIAATKRIALRTRLLTRAS
jgi:hypothetical protein